MTTKPFFSSLFLSLAMASGLAACGQELATDAEPNSPTVFEDFELGDAQVSVAIFPVGEMAPTGDLYINGERCGALPCRTAVDIGAEVTVELVEGPGSRFESWYGIEGCAKRSICQFTATDHVYVDIEVAPSSPDTQVQHTGTLVHGALERAE